MIFTQDKLSKFVETGLIKRKTGLPPVIDIASISLHLGKLFIRYKKTDVPIELPTPIETETVPIEGDGSVLFPPGCCILASTDEILSMPFNLMGFVQTKGTIARGFVTVHLCDGQIDPGYEGAITLELVNLSDITYLLRPGVPIAQLFIHSLNEAVEKGYEGRYQHALEPTSMRTSTQGSVSS